MALVWLGVVGLLLKWLEIGPVAQWSWWTVLAPFGMAIVWWSVSDALGFTARARQKREDAHRDRSAGATPSTRWVARRRCPPPPPKSAPIPHPCRAPGWRSGDNPHLFPTHGVPPMLVHPQFDPVALNLGFLQIHWYGLTYLAAFGLFYWLATRRIRQPPYAAGGWTPREVEDLLFYGVMGVILGGRLGYVLFYKPAYYLANPGEIFAVWKGAWPSTGGCLA